MMRPLWKDMLAALVMGLIVPGLFLNTVSLLMNSKEKPIYSEAPAETSEQLSGLTMRLHNPDGTVSEMDMDRYLLRVLLAEVPAEFEAEALKAQAVAARTYTRKAWESGGKHGDGSVCTKASCCQAYITEEEYLLQGGSQEGIDKMRDAVCSTSGQVLLYEDVLIEATYFSCSGGSTEDAAAVWGCDYPYLQAVKSPGEENAAHFTDTASFSLQQFQNALGLMLPEDAEDWIGPVFYTEGGGVAEIEIGGELFTGIQIRNLLGLRSTNFVITAGDNITITTKGYGHRVGMSQHGADAMAVAGSTYEEILKHYYQGTVLAELKA